MKIQEITIRSSVEYLDKMLPFEKHFDKERYIKKRIYPPVQELTILHGIDIIKNYDDTIEDMPPNQLTASYLYQFMFNDEHPKVGDVLYIRFVERVGLIFKAKEMKHFMLKGYNEFFGEYPDVGFEDLYFLFLETNEIYVFEHPGVTYKIECFTGTNVQ